MAAKAIQEQGIQVIPLHFKIPFCHYDKKLLDKTSTLSLLVKENLGIELKQVDISDEFLGLLKKPRHGFGSNMNPCIDCKILMLEKARGLMEEEGVSFVVTGEVLGQRPMSQHRQALETIEKKSGLEGLLLRPLSAKRLPETIPESKGWVKREGLMDFSGRTRKPQIGLAGILGLKGYPNPSGGCLLTDPEFAKRLKELINHEGLTQESIELLRYGRHFRLTPKARLIVGRNEKEDKALEALAKENDYLFYPSQELAGATSLGVGVFNEELIKLSCVLTCRYCDVREGEAAAILYRRVPDKSESVLTVGRANEDTLRELRVQG